MGEHHAWSLHEALETPFAQGRDKPPQQLSSCTSNHSSLSSEAKGEVSGSTTLGSQQWSVRPGNDSMLDVMREDMWPALPNGSKLMKAPSRMVMLVNSGQSISMIGTAVYSY